jgi:DeoR/GlpR family transcriptional regulator of sugar metabolism
VHGGATTVSGRSTEEPGFEAKFSLQTAQKAAIARAAGALVSPGDSVAVSGGTTTYAVAMELRAVADLTVVTNSIPVADLLHGQHHDGLRLLLTGGTRTPSDALVGPVAQDAAARLNLDLLFLGVHGMSLRSGFTTPNLSEADTNRALVASARHLVVLADHTKWDLIGIATIAKLSDAHVVVSDPYLAEDARLELEQYIDELIIADLPPGTRPSLEEVDQVGMAR